MKPSGADYDNFKSARDKKGSAEVTDAATTREHAFTGNIRYSIERQEALGSHGWSGQDHKDKSAALRVTRGSKAVELRFFFLEMLEVELQAVGPC